MMCMYCMHVHVCTCTARDPSSLQWENMHLAKCVGTCTFAHSVLISIVWCYGTINSGGGRGGGRKGGGGRGGRGGREREGEGGGGGGGRNGEREGEGGKRERKGWKEGGRGNEGGGGREDRTRVG